MISAVTEIEQRRPLRGDGRDRLSPQAVQPVPGVELSDDITMLAVRREISEKR
jgi:hypothetical protein